MDKNAIKKYAVWARRELIERVSQRAMFYGVTSQKIGDPDAAEVNGRLLSSVEKKQRQALIQNVREKGYEQVMEEVAYTWFNRFAALRFMEVNGYLPSLIRVFTNELGEFKPQILSEALHLELEGLNKQKVLELESGNKSEELFRYLLIVQCNALNSILPGMFQRIEDYTELLLPDNLLRDGSVIEQMVSCIPEEDWTDQVQIIGWLYQYYNTEPKDKVFADLKKNIKITKENIPAATQLFTPDWIVHYMVENSLGRLWLEGHPNDTLKSEWKYYLDEAEQEPEVEAQLAEIRKEYAALKPEEIRVIDPCCGSGHILVVMFDVLVQIYEDYGYTAREAAVKIVENNLWGLDIDERAAQLSYFAVMMKARQYDRRFFTREVQPHVYAVEESNGISEAALEHFAGSDLAVYFSGRDNSNLLKDIINISTAFKDAKEYGSILNVRNADFTALYARFEEIRNEVNQDILAHEVLEILFPLVEVAQVLAQKYHIVVTNPPYMGNNTMTLCLGNYVKEVFPNVKSDMSTVFMEKNINWCLDNGYIAMINTPVWMFLSSYEKLREAIIENNTVVNMLHFGRGVFGADFGTVAFVLEKAKIPGYFGNYRRLFDKQSIVDSIETKEKWFFEKKGEYFSDQGSYRSIQGSPFAYWASKEMLAAFLNGEKLKTYGDTRQGMATSDNNRFLRMWYEVDFLRIGIGFTTPEDAKQSMKKWFPYNKGGEFRKWYGNIDYVINYENDGFEVKQYASSLYKSASRTIKSMSEYFKPCLSWSKVTIGNIAFRYYPAGFIFDVAGCCIFYLDEHIQLYDFGFLNSKVARSILSVISPTVNYEAGHIASLPVLRNQEQSSVIEALVKKNIILAKEDWDVFEVSWDFKRHPLCRKSSLICEAFSEWGEECRNRFDEVKKNEERINQVLIELYDLSDELESTVNPNEVTIRLADISRDIKSFISYAVGCMFGRYSLDQIGIVFAGGTFKPLNYSLFLPDIDSIIPICDDEYFEDDIVGRFVKFVEVVYGKETLEENLRFIADALGGKGSSREVIRNYFINDFYADHLKVYQKRPIYWLFDSGKKNGFKCLIYMHRYQPDTIARIRTDYVHEQQSRYRTAIADLEHRVDGASPSERVKLNKQLSKIRGQAEELRVYEEKIHHLADQMISIDLDDGVKVNYAKFQDVLAKIK